MSDQPFAWDDWGLIPDREVSPETLALTKRALAASDARQHLSPAQYAKLIAPSLIQPIGDPDPCFICGSTPEISTEQQAFCSRCT